MAKSRRPAVLVIRAAHIDAVRKAADHLGLEYEVIDGEANSARFCFAPLEDAAVLALAAAIPADAFVHSAIIGGDPLAG